MSGELERAYGALRWIYTNGMKSDRPQSVSDVCNEAFASYRIAQADMPAPRPAGMDTRPTPKSGESATGEILQADREAAADLLDEISSLLDHVGFGQVADLIRDGEYDEHEATQAFAAHRRAFSGGVDDKVRIVAWLRERQEIHRSEWGVSIDIATRDIADAIERGDYLPTIKEPRA